MMYEFTTKNPFESEMRKCELQWATKEKLQEALQWLENEDARHPELFENKVEKKLTLSDLNLKWLQKWLQRDYDGVSSAEESVFKFMYGPKEKYWRNQREFFYFVAGHDNIEKIALITAAQSVVEAMRLAGEDEDTVRRYKRNFIAPVLREQR